MTAWKAELILGLLNSINLIWFIFNLFQLHTYCFIYLIITYEMSFISNYVPVLKTWILITQIFLQEHITS